MTCWNFKGAKKVRATIIKKSHRTGPIPPGKTLTILYRRQPPHNLVIGVPLFRTLLFFQNLAKKANVQRKWCLYGTRACTEKAWTLPVCPSRLPGTLPLEGAGQIVCLALVLTVSLHSDFFDPAAGHVCYSQTYLFAVVLEIDRLPNFGNVSQRRENKTGDRIVILFFRQMQV